MMSMCNNNEAIFVGDYRYFLSRHWMSDWPAGNQSRVYTWIMLNPSTADEKTDDDTIKELYDRSPDAKCINVVNLSAYISPNAEDLKQFNNVVGLKGDVNKWRDNMERAINEADEVVFAWGMQIRHNKGLKTIINEVQNLVKTLKPSCVPKCLGKTNGGHPCHPNPRSGTAQMHLDPFY